MKIIQISGFTFWFLFASCSNEMGNLIVDEVDAGSFNEMVLIRGQSYLMGNEKAAENGEVYPEEGPVHQVEVSSFWIDKYEVTNAQFKEFVDAAKVKGIDGSKSEIENSKPWVTRRIKALIARQVWSDEGFYRAINEDDVMMNKALELFDSNNRDFSDK